MAAERQYRARNIASRSHNSRRARWGAESRAPGNDHALEDAVLPPRDRVEELEQELEALSDGKGYRSNLPEPLRPA